MNRPPPHATDTMTQPAEPDAQTHPPEAPLPGHRRGRVYTGRDFTEGSVPKNLWALAWPLMVSGFIQTLDHVAELVWAGLLGFRALGSIGVAQGWIQFFNTGRQGFDTATRAMVSRAVGAKDMELANHIASQALVFNVVLAWTVMLLGINASSFLLRILGVSDAMVDAGLLYLQLRFVSTSTFALMHVTGSILEASGDSMTPMKAQFLSRAVLIPLSPVLIFGLLGLPPLGLAGAAVAASVGQLCGVTMTLRVLFSGRTRVRIKLAGFRPDFPLYWRMIKLGAPSSWNTGERALAQILLTGVVAPFGDAMLAAFSLSQRLQQFVNLGQMGVGQAAGVIVGQNLGAKRVDRARQTALWALGQCALLSFLVGTVIFFFPEAFLSLFTREHT
ncbi:MAG: MATE family efflux transporter, partial [Dehalococcoidia bacterium]|nr:MATE family efflux transporter [Dehalococcoidia bacterium]